MAVKRVNMHEAKTNLSKLISELPEGGEVIIANRGRPVARIVPIARPSGPRPLGQIDLGGKLDDETLAALASISTDGDLDQIGWPR